MNWELYSSNHLLSLLSRLHLGALLSRSFRAASARRGFAFAGDPPHEPEDEIPSWRFLMLLKFSARLQISPQSS